MTYFPSEREFSALGLVLSAMRRNVRAIPDLCPVERTHMLSSTFTPDNTGTDPLTFADIKAADDGVFGSGSDEARFVVLNGTVFRRDITTGDLPTIVADTDPEASDNFRHLAGELTITFHS